MPSICLCFVAHQPYRLRHYTFFDIGQSHDYVDDDLNRNFLSRIVQRCYLPANEILLKLIRQYKGDVKIALSLTGTLIDQLEQYQPDALDSFKRLGDTGQVEFVNQAYYHSLAFLFSMREFQQQVRMNRDKIKALFGQTTRTYLNTEMIYNNDLAAEMERQGYKTILTEGADQILGWRSPNFVYQPIGCRSLKCLLRNYRLSDDIAFRFSDRGWSEHPLTAQKYAGWLHRINSGAEVVNLFLNYETFGEHHRRASGIFEFLEQLPGELLSHPDFDFLTPSAATQKYQPVAQLDVSQYISCADEEKDLTAWHGNHMQRDAMEVLYRLEGAVRKTKNNAYLSLWRMLQSSDHFYYMCTKSFSDGEVHRYFNAYPSPYDAYINYMNIISDFFDTIMTQTKPTRKKADRVTGRRRAEKR